MVGLVDVHAFAKQDVIVAIEPTTVDKVENNGEVVACQPRERPFWGGRDASTRQYKNAMYWGGTHLDVGGDVGT